MIPLHRYFPLRDRLPAYCYCHLVLPVILVVALAIPNSATQAPDQPAVRFLRYEEVGETLAKFASSNLPGAEISGGQQWDSWIRAQDREVRARIDRGVDDSISNLILYGTSFTKLPRIPDLEEARDKSSGKLKPLAASRVRQLEAALDSVVANERVSFIRSFLQRQHIAKADRHQYLVT